MRLLSLSILFAMCTMKAAFAAEPILGWWQTETEGQQYGHVEIGACEGGVCGTLRRGYDMNGVEGTSPDMGRVILSEVKSTGSGTYTGRAYRPANGKTYNVRITVIGDSLEIKGCLVGKILCETSTWSRVP